MKMRQHSKRQAEMARRWRIGIDRLIQDTGWASLIHFAEAEKAIRTAEEAMLRFAEAIAPTVNRIAKGIQEAARGFANGPR